MSPPGPMATRQDGPLGPDGKVPAFPRKKGPMGQAGPIGTTGPMGQASPVELSGRPVPAPPGKRGSVGSSESPRPVGPPRQPGTQKSANLTGLPESSLIPILDKPNSTYSTNDGDPDWATTAILRTDGFSVLYTGNNPASSVPHDDMPINPTYSRNKGDPDWTVAILRTEDLSVLYTADSGIDSSSIPQDEMLSFGTDSCSIGRSFCLIATVVLVGSGATIATILTMMFHNTKEHDIQTPKPTQDSRHWTTVNLTAPAVIAGSVSTNIHILHSTNGKVRPMGLNPPNMTEPSGKTGPILPGDAVSNRPIGPPVPPTPPLPPSEMEPMGRAGPVEQNGRDGVPRSPRPTKPPKGKGPVGSQDLPEPVGFFGPPVGLQRRPTYPFERPQTNIGGKSDKVSCKGGYTVFRGICYKVFKIYQTFSEAAETCRANGGTLAMPRDALTNNFLISLYQKSVSNDPLWFGLHDRREEGKFEWADGSPLGEYSSWGALRPDNGLFARFQNCVQYPNYNGLTIAGSRWYDNNCDLRFFFICQVIPGNETA
ncbi:uncharacterized protein [Branchiostoma lanceolatum]|uniref:uncharacterized protein isoform X1 n=1 Tax=Branchiostoma lanceolatum TaxID=7740 RepID=UPI0034512925